MSIRKKINLMLLMISAIFFVLVVSVGWSYFDMWSSYKEVEKNRSLQKSIKSIRIATDQARILEALFLANKQENYRDEFAELLVTSKEKVELLLKQDKDSEMIKPAIAMEEILSSYEFGFDKVASLHKNMGYTSEEGYRGRLAKNAKEVGEILNQFKDVKLKWDWLQIRLLEKEYFEGKKENSKLIKELLNEVKIELKKMVSKDHPLIKPAGLIDGYQSNFDRLRFYLTEAEEMTLTFHKATAHLPKILSLLESTQRQAEEKIFREANYIMQSLGWLFAALVIAVVLVLLKISRWAKEGISDPLQTITEASICIAQGDMDHPLELVRDDEIGALARSFDSMRASVKQKIQSLQLLNSVSEEMAGKKKNRDLLKLTIHTLMVKFESDLGFAYLYNSKNKFRLKASETKGGLFPLPKELLSPSGAIKEVLKTNQPQTLKSGSHQELDMAILSPFAFLIIPIQIGGEVVGILALGSKSKDFVLDSEMDFLLRTLSRLLSVNLQNIQMIKQINRQNRTLEATVRLRTNDIVEILDNTGQGILVFEDDYLVKPSYSKICLDMLSPQIEAGVKSLTNLDIRDLLIEDNGKEIFEECLSFIFTDPKANKAILNFLPTEVNLGDKILAVQFQPLVNEQGKVKVMVILSDITKEKKLARLSFKEDQKKQLIIKMVSDPHGVKLFIKETERQLKELMMKPKAPFSTDTMLRVLHTIKGNTAGYNFFEVAKLAHNIESYIQDLTKFDEAEAQKLQEKFAELFHLFQDKIDEISNLLPEFFTQEDKLEIHPEKLLLLQKATASKLTGDDLIGFNAQFSKLFHQPVKNLMKGYPKMIDDLASQLGKQVKLQITGSEMEANLEDLTPVFSNLGHLLRNAIDHGVESLMEREELGKKRTGKITIDFQDNQNSLQLNIKDDGAGIDPKRIRESAVKKGVITAEESNHFNDKDALNLIFHAGFSTRDAATAVSGRGIGMDSVKVAIEDCGGSIEVDSILGQGTQFNIVLPTTT